MSYVALSEGGNVSKLSVQSREKRLLGGRESGEVGTRQLSFWTCSSVCVCVCVCVCRTHTKRWYCGLVTGAVGDVYR